MNDGQIIVTTTGVVILPYSEGQSKQLEYETSRYDKIYHKAIPTTGFYNEKLEAFATYKMSPYKLKEFFPSYDVVYHKNYSGKTMSDFSMTVELNRYQDDAISQLIGLKKHEAYVNIPTASGKTVLAVAYSCMLKKKTFIMCYSSKILEQWEKTFETKTTMNSSRIMELSSSKQMNGILIGKVDVKDIDVFLCTGSLLDMFGKQYGYEKIHPLFMEMGIGLKIIDEAHTRLGTTIRCNAYTSIDKTLYLSADYNQADNLKFRQFKSVFMTVPVIRLRDELMNELKHITASVWSFNSHPGMDDLLRVTSNKYGWSNMEYCRYEFENQPIKDALVALLEYIWQNDTSISPSGKPYKILILTQLIEHVDLIYDIVNKMELKGRNVSKFYSTLESAEKEFALDADIIVSTYKSFSTGIDVTSPQIRHVISTCPVDVVTANQSAGRCRPIPGMQSYFWLLSDYGFDHCPRNIEKVLRYLKQNKIGNVKRIHYENDEIRDVSTNNAFEEKTT